MSAIRLLILGVLMPKKPLHGYEIRQELESWNAAMWANIAYGSIYFALKKMAEEHLIRPVEEGTDQGRNLYEILPAGEKHFMQLLRKQWWDVKPMIDPLQVAVCFMNHMPKDELMAALSFRADRLKFMVASTEKVLPAKMKGWEAPRHIEENFRLATDHQVAELAWTEQALEKVKKDELP